MKESESLLTSFEYCMLLLFKHYFDVHIYVSMFLLQTWILNEIRLLCLQHMGSLLNYVQLDAEIFVVMS